MKLPQKFSQPEILFKYHKQVLFIYFYFIYLFQNLLLSSSLDNEVVYVLAF